MIATRNGTIRHIGTQYEVRTLPSGVQVSVREGRVVVDTDGDEVISQDPGTIGAVALEVVSYSKRGGAPSGSLGYKIGAAAAVDTAIT